MLFFNDRMAKVKEKDLAKAAHTAEDSRIPAIQTYQYLVYQMTEIWV